MTNVLYCIGCKRFMEYVFLGTKSTYLTVY